ncbi:MAG TPA: DUF2059 domain-containing protein, partial [Caldimonas sp.]|nr:DUF2059 domain-containing protein [Caldimonas sp.]
MKRILAAALIGVASLAHAQPASAPVSPAKKALVDKLLQLQQPGIEVFARNLLQMPAMRMMQEAGLALQRQVAPDKREAVGKQIEAEMKKFMDESVPLVRERAIKIAPSTIGPFLEEKFSEDELKQLIAWFESPVNKKYQEIGPQMQNAFVQKLTAESAPVIDPKLQALDAKLRVLLNA